MSLLPAESTVVVGTYNPTVVYIDRNGRGARRHWLELS